MVACWDDHCIKQEEPRSLRLWGSAAAEGQGMVWVARCWSLALLLLLGTSPLLLAPTRPPAPAAAAAADSIGCCNLLLLLLWFPCIAL